MNSQPIGVFDSGLGGLTVVRALQRHLPGEQIVYFGDTARVPYGNKSQRTILQFSEQNCRFLMQFEPKLLVVACNTASALALPELEERVSVPVIGVIEPGASEAVQRAKGRAIAVLATEATVASGAYLQAIQRLAPSAAVTQRACPSLVALIEEGRPGGDHILRALVCEYLEDVIPLHPGVVLLGCTHYPLVESAIADLMPSACIVDSADATARRIKQLLSSDGSLCSQVGGGRLRCYVSDNPNRFREIGSRFLGNPGGLREVTWVTPEQFSHEPTPEPLRV
jgi:glutamate racemase